MQLALDEAFVAPPSAGSSAKDLGAFYTDPRVARFLVRWSVIRSADKVLDPGFGGGVFLQAAVERLLALGGEPQRQVHGIELDEAAHLRLTNVAGKGLPAQRLVRANFFLVSPDRLPKFDAVVGNPPFIRYQRFNGQLRRIALERALEQGVRLSRLSSSWAPFLVHACRFLKPGGRLAMVVPAELLYAGYARPVLAHLRDRFARTRVLLFAQKLFPRLSEDTVLVLAEGWAEPFERVEMVPLDGVEVLEGILEPAGGLPPGSVVDMDAVLKGEERVHHYSLPPRTRALYMGLRGHPQVAQLGSLGDVGIGYVTGANDFFHVDGRTARRYELPDSVLVRAVRGGGELTGIRFTLEDWQRLHDRDHANLLLSVPPGCDLSQSVRRYLEEGERRHIPERYKCRVRTPWYSVPHVYRAEAFLTYMSGSVPKLVVNEAGAVVPNTLHTVRLRDTGKVDATLIALAFQSSLSALSCEMEGHGLGGGMLKLEPGEAARVLIPLPELPRAAVRGLAGSVDELLRRGRRQAGRELMDEVFLIRGLGLSAGQVSWLREGWQALRSRRLRR